MGRSLFGKLHRRYGRRPTGAEKARHARQFEERLRASLPIGVLQARPAASAPAPTVAVIGAGFAGCAAAHVLGVNLGWTVTVYDPMGTPGGRVASSTSIVPGRILEAGAELIGLNHPLWIFLADAMGLALGVVTPDDDYAGMGLSEPLVMGGVPYDSEEIYNGMNSLFSQWMETAEQVTNPLAPWLAANAPALDSENLYQQVKAASPPVAPEVASAIELEFELNNTLPTYRQSWLANLAQFQAGQMGPASEGLNFFDYTEVFRCTAGNQALAYALLGSMSVVAETVTAIDTSNGVTLTFASGDPSPTFDYVVVATSLDVWSNIEVDGKPFPYEPIRYGHAIKYLAPVAQRFWLQQQLAPSSMSDTLGMTWEGTDNQADTAGFELTVFAGGSLAKAAIENGGTDAYFTPLISAIYPGFSLSAGGTFANEGPSVLKGYSCPSPKEVTGAQQSYVTPYSDCLAVAGEHTSPAWFGFMEGALESGVAAALRLATCASVDLDAEWGGTSALHAKRPPQT